MRQKNNPDLKILVTGGAGFIGSALIRHIINNTSYSVLNVDKLTYAGNLNSLKEISDCNRYFFEKIDICDAPSIKRILNSYNPDFIMHLAAESHVDKSINGPSDFINTNIIGTYTLLEESRAYWESLIPIKKSQFRFHHISTDEVFGDLGIGDKKNSVNKLDPPLFTETSSYKPSSPYSASKASSDHLVRAWNKTYGIPTIITNCSNNYGPYQHPEKLIPLTIMNAINKKSIPIYGTGEQIRDWLYVEDHAKALMEVILNSDIGKTYNIGGHNEYKNIEVVQTICNILDKIIPWEENYSSLIKHIDDRPGHDFRYAIDAQKIKQDIGWYPENTFDHGIEKTINWYINNIEEFTILDHNNESI